MFMGEIITWKERKCADKSRKCGGGAAQWGLAVLLVGIVLLYSSLYFSNTFPLSEGWNVNYAELVFHGKVPYRDFYYYLPPLNLLIDMLLWKLSFGSLFVYRAWWLLQRITIYELMFGLLCRYFNRYAAFIACAFSAILCTASTYDLFGDYNQTVPFLSVILMYCVLGFAEAENTKVAYKRLFQSGIVFGLLFLNKQTIFIAAGVIYVIALSLYCWKLKDKNFPRYCIAVICGFLVVFVLSMTLLAVNGALIPFFQQVFMHTGGKGSPIEILLKIFTGWTINASVFLLVVGLVTAAKLVQKEDVQSRITGGVVFLLSVVGAYILERETVEDFITVFSNAKSLQVVVILGGLLLLLLYEKKNSSGSDCIEKFFNVLCVAYILAVLITARYAVLSGEDKSFVEAIYEKGTLYDCVTKVLYTAVSFLNLYLIGKGFLQIESTNADNRGKAIFWMACGSFSTIYAASMAAASEISFHGVMLAMQLVLCYVLSKTFPDKSAEKLMRCGVIALCTVLSIGCVAQKVVCSYSWWGSEQENSDEKIYATGIPALRGFRFSKDDDDVIEKITNLILENTTEDSTIFGYPYIKIFNILTDRYNMNTFVPVLFYDVVDDQYVLEENQLLQENLPDIVLWKEIPNCKEVHESVYRDGAELKQRILEKDFSKLLATEYNLLGAYGKESTGLIKVYKLDDEKKINEFALKGEGTYENPYLIQTAEDLRTLSEYVNKGMSFEGQYVEQTKDIDLKDEEIAPIGKFGGYNYFRGTYNGAGHVIRNLYIDESDSKGNVALFGCLGGKVYNLGLEKGSISGGCTGGIASHSAPGTDAEIVNCYTDIDVTGIRAGGIADNFNGYVVNCFSVGKLSGENNADALSYNLLLGVKAVYTAQENNSQTFLEEDMKVPEITYCSLETFENGALVDALNNELGQVYTDIQQLHEDQENGSDNNQTKSTNKIELIHWKQGDDGHPVFDLN